MVPRDALAYVEVTLRPSGATRDDALAAAGKLLNTPAPAARIRGLLQQGFAKADPPVNYARDIAPWLGDRAAVWVGTPGASGANPPVGAIVALRDEDLARKKLGALAARDGKPVKRSVDGEDYEIYPGSDSTAVAYRDGELLVGTEAAVRRMLTLADDGSLAAGSAYKQATSALDATRLGDDLHRLASGCIDYSLRSSPPGGAAVRAAAQADRQRRPAAGRRRADGGRHERRVRVHRQERPRRCGRARPALRPHRRGVAQEPAGRRGRRWACRTRPHAQDLLQPDRRRLRRRGRCARRSSSGPGSTSSGTSSRGWATSGCSRAAARRARSTAAS